ncbi:MAG: outer membrane beta-barrel protein [Flavicella sp.]|nr:outer membrane beta-barrel protein [Flavicella sp.]
MKKIVLSALLLATTVAFAQESKVSVSGTVDMYGTTNFADGTGTPGILVANPQNANRFGLGSINTVFAYEGEKSGFVADLAFGPKADDANLAGAINQLYAYYNVSDKTTITAGQFNTFLGYEVISPAANFNYTVSYLFNAGPFSHTGVKLDYAASEDLSYMLAVTNSHAISSADGNVGGEMQFGAQVGYKGQYLNFIYGGVDGSGITDNMFVDYTGGFDLSDSLFLGINAAYSYSEDADAGYQGAALYIENTFSDSFALGLRPEFFQMNGASDATVTALTLAASSSLTDNLKVITELRMDSSEDGQIEAFPTEKSVSALTIAAVYSF